MEQTSFGDASLEGAQHPIHRVWPPIIAIALSGILCWFWLIPGVSVELSPKASVDGNISTLDQVADNDIPAALGTMSGSADFLGQFKSRKDGCPVPLAWVSLARTSGAVSGKVRLRSGSYYSPEFEPGDLPLRVAIPYPGSYEAGHGALEVISVGGNTTVALFPAWQVVAGGARTVRQVVWQPSKRCANSNG
jgi:hypothetical protein